MTWNKIQIYTDLVRKFCPRGIYLKDSFWVLGVKINQFNPILRGIKSNLYKGGQGRVAYMPPLWFLGKKVFCPIPFAHSNNYQNRVTHQKPGLYLEKQKNGGRFKIAVCNMTGGISSIFCIFYLFALKWL